MKAGEYVLVLGDFGIPWDYSREDDLKLDTLEELPATFLFVDGNHENYEMLESYPIESWNGGMIHRLRENVIHLMRGYVFDLDGVKCFAFGGARSIDKMYRMEGITWWKEEIPSKEEFMRAKENLAKAAGRVDLVFTHTAPRKFISPYKDELGFDPSYREDKTMKMLSALEADMKYQRWYFGHFHKDFFDDERKARWMYRNIDYVEW